MTVTYTTNFNFPKLDNGSGNSGAVLNGVLELLDYYLNPDIILTYDGEVLTYDGNVVIYDDD